MDLFSAFSGARILTARQTLTILLLNESGLQISSVMTHAHLMPF
jgi:hypothetical protein